MISTWHEGVYHAAQPCQADSLPLTRLHWRGLKRTGQVESPKNTGFLTGVEHEQCELRRLSSSACMLVLCLLKDGRLIALVTVPPGKDDPDPDIGKRSYSDGVAFAFGSLALGIVCGPRLAQGGLPGKLMKRIAQRFDTAKAPMGLGIHPTLIQHGRGSTQGLQAACVLIAQAIISDFRQESWSQVLACARPALKDLVVRMGQKKGLNLLVVLRNLLDQGQELTHQRQHQRRFGPCDHRISLQMWLVQVRENAGCPGSRMGISGVFEDSLDLFQRSGHRFLRGRVGLQEVQRAFLVQLPKQFQSHWVIGLETGGELIDQARLHLDQGVLVAREQLEFCYRLTIWRETMQIGQVSSSRLGQQVGIYRIRLRTRCGPPTIHGARIDRIDWPPCLQQVSTQQSVGGLNDASHLLFCCITDDLLQKRVQLGKSLRVVINTKRSYWMSFFVNHHRVMVVICPIDPGIPQGEPPLWHEWFLNARALLLWRSKRDSLMIGSVQERYQGSASFLNRSSRVEELDFPWHIQQLSKTRIPLFQPCVERACS
jgi:hypothetical protein